MKTKNFERLKKSLGQAAAFERGEASAVRITVLERGVKKRRVIMGRLAKGLLGYLETGRFRYYYSPTDQRTVDICTRGSFEQLRIRGRPSTQTDGAKR